MKKSPMMKSDSPVYAKNFRFTQPARRRSGSWSLPGLPKPRKPKG
jgi:hypothetical protein